MNREHWLTSSRTGIKCIALAGALMLTSISAALACGDERVSFRDFRSQNLDLSKQDARRAFRIEHRQHVLAERAEHAGAANSIVLETLNTVAPNLVDTTQVLNLHGARHRSTQLSETGQTTRLSNGLDLNLSSSRKNISLGRNLFADGGTIQITVGGETKTVGAGSLVSAAEYVAVKQVLSGGSQQVSLDQGGRAVGGNVDLETIASDRNALRASNLLIPENVTTSGDFSRNSEFRLLGDLNNYGTVHALSDDGSKRSGAIRAVDINNFKNASILSDIDLTLDASGNLNNEGRIESSGNLVLSAQGTINNNRGTVKSNGSIHLQSATINNNRGTIISQKGDVHVEGSEVAALVVDNRDGTMQALNGAINVRSSTFNGQYDSYFVGGDLLSQAVNLQTGQGTATVFVDKLTGVLHEYGYAAHVSAATDELKVGSICLNGDPTIFNTTGNIAIIGDILTSERLVLVASGNIVSVNNITIQAGDATRGQGIEMIAGADFTATAGCGCKHKTETTISIPPLANPSAVDLSGTKSKTGGGILLGENVNIIARATDLSGNKNGDVVGLLAFSGKGDTAGTIDAHGVTIQTGGAGTGFNGDVYILAEGTNGNVIRTGVIDTTGGSTSGGTDHDGKVGVFTVDIVSSIPGQHVTYDAAGNRTSAAFLTGQSLNTSGNVVVTDTAAPIDINASGGIRLHGGGQLSLEGQVVAATGSATVGDIELVSNGAVVNGTNGSAVSTVDVFLSAPNIGTATAPIRLDAPIIQSFGGKGPLNFIQVLGTGALQIGGTSNGTISFDAQGRDVSTLTFGPILSSNVISIKADTLGILDNVEADSISISTVTGNILNANFASQLTTNKLFLSSTSGSIGASGNALNVRGGLSQLGATAGGGVFLNSPAGKVVFTDLGSANGAVIVTTQDSTTLPATVTAGGGILSITENNNGTMTIPGQITARDGITLINNAGNGKMAFAKDATLATTAKTPGLGNINISVGPAGTPLATPPANVTTNITGTGTIVFTGSGLKAKTPTNNLNVIGSSSITINNGLSSAAITFGGNVTMTADPPVDPNTPTVTTVGSSRKLRHR